MNKVKHELLSYNLKLSWYQTKVVSQEIQKTYFSNYFLRFSVFCFLFSWKLTEIHKCLAADTGAILRGVSFMDPLYVVIVQSATARTASRTGGDCRDLQEQIPWATDNL